MQKSKLFVTSLVMFASLCPLWGQSGYIRQLNFEPFSNFQRFEIFSNEEPNVKINPDLNNRTITISLNQNCASSILAPQTNLADIRILRTDGNSMFIIKLPYYFRYESFYFKPSKKYIVDFYRETQAIQSAPIQQPRIESPKPKETIPDKTESDLPIIGGSPYSSGLRALQEGDTTLAIDYFHKAIVQNPAHSRAHMQLGTIYSAQGEVERAKEHFRNAQKDIELRFMAELQIQNLKQHESENILEMTNAAQNTNEPKSESEPEFGRTVDKVEGEKEAAPNSKFAVMLNSSKSLFASLKLKLMIGTGALMFLAISILVFRRTRKKAAKGKSREKQVQRILSMIEKNKFYQSQQKAKPAERPPQTFPDPVSRNHLYE